MSGNARPLPPTGPWPSKNTLPFVVAALKRPGGATLAELTKASGWLAEFDIKHLCTAAKKLNFETVNDGATGTARRYRAI
jgi:hypothetical protein